MEVILPDTDWSDTAGVAGGMRKRGKHENKRKRSKIIKEYNNFILVEHEAGYKECISKHDLGLVK